MAVEYTPAWKSEDTGQEEQDLSDLRGLKKKLFDDDDQNESEPEGPNSRKQPVLIYLRVRPKRPVEVSNHDPDCLHQINDFEMLALPPRTSKTYKNSRTETNHKFSFSHIFSPATTQKELFDETLRPLLKDFFGGQNCLVFTYGVTNSGKHPQSHVGVWLQNVESVHHTSTKLLHNKSTISGHGQFFLHGWKRGREGHRWRFFNGSW